MECGTSLAPFLFRWRLPNPLKSLKVLENLRVFHAFPPVVHHKMQNFFALQTAMKHFSLGSRFLKDRSGWWHYVRRVPARFKDVDRRGLIQIALRTQSLELAMMRRNSLAEADAALWNSLALKIEGTQRSRSRAGQAGVLIPEPQRCQNPQG